MALEDGTLVVNAPLGTGLFCRWTGEGNRRCFGQRRPAPPGAEGEENSFLLAAVGDGLVAAHPFRPLLRGYSGDGQLRWEQ
ncbi:MAG: hypothetical protein NZ869_00985 [Thermoanaerobaculum sp.]|nr:hypothetical protein [Thermoanaerobaculum sp.]